MHLAEMISKVIFASEWMILLAIAGDVGADVLILILAGRVDVVIVSR